MRKPGHGMPIGRVIGGERPLYRVPVEPALNVDVFRHKAVVVVIDKRVMNRRVVKSDGGDCQDKAENQRSPLRSRGPGSSGPGSGEPARSRLRQSPLLRFLASMLGFQTSRSHSSPVFDEYIRWARSSAG